MPQVCPCRVYTGNRARDFSFTQYGSLILEKYLRMQTTAEYYCAYCGEPNLTFVDLSAGGQQSYVEDCQVCCHPNILYIRVDEDTLDIEIDTEYEE